MIARAGCVLLMLSACTLPPASLPQPEIRITPQASPSPEPAPTPFPTRPKYLPGELVDYTAQTGDTLAALAARFNTTLPEILTANPNIPANATTMPPGMPMKIPIYYLPFWGPQNQIVPDWHFVNGPSASGFATETFVAGQAGWLAGYTAYVAGETRSGAGMVDYVAGNFSVSPRLLLALLEFQTGALSQPQPPASLDAYPLGYENDNNRGLYLQLVWAANKLNDAYYRWRLGALTEFELSDGQVERPDPWQNAGTVAIQYFYAGLPVEQYRQAISPGGFAAVYQALFGDPWAEPAPHIPGSLVQPEFQLPFEPGIAWTYTGGPHTGWGTGAPYAAIDFAPPSKQAGCFESADWATALADGVVTRSETGMVALDTDGDGDEHTGWVIFYLHLATEGRAPLGAALAAGEPVGHASCEGGTSTGSHIHIARKFNGEWVPAGAGVLPFVMDGWMAVDGAAPYLGTLVRGGRVVIACECSNLASRIEADR
jgi:hypothetical protein